jgi:hypothetical protein
MVHYVQVMKGILTAIKLSKKVELLKVPKKKSVPCVQ